jgi:transcriptional regulator with XRE-family HTH domain
MLACLYIANMAQAYDHDWYLADWMAATDVSQAQLVRATGFPKSKISMLVNGHRKYHREDLNDLARAMNILPFELLMHPEDAMRMRRLRETAVSIAADSRVDYRPEPKRING